MKGSRAVKDTAGIFGTRMLVSAMGVVVGVILARWLGPYDRGVLALVLLASATVVTLTKLGISQATVYYVNRQQAPVDKIAANSLALALALGVAGAALVWGLHGNLLRSVLADVPPWALALALVRVPLMLFDNYLFGILQATGRFGIYNSRILASEAMRLVLVAVAVMLLNLGLAAAVAIYTFMSVLNTAWLMASMRDAVRFSLAVDFALLADMLSFGLRSYVQVVTAHLLLRVDVYMVQALLGDPRQTAFYALALHLTETVLEVPQAIGLVLYPRLAALPEEEIHRITAQTCRRMLVLTIPAAALLAVFGPWVITLWYGEAFAPAGAPLPWAAVGVAAMALFVIVTRDFTARSKQRVNTTAGLLALAANVALNLYLIPRYGIVGAAFATAAAYSAACAVLMYFFRAESGLPWTSVLVPTRDDIGYLVGLARRGVSATPWRRA